MRWLGALALVLLPGVASAEWQGEKLSTLLQQGYEPFAVVALERRTHEGKYDAVVTERIYLRTTGRLVICTRKTEWSSDLFVAGCFSARDN
ncbi:MAG: hypothetical protein AAFR79_16055 [Pseudomonadota bacterium]